MGVTGIEDAKDLAIGEAANVGKGLVGAGVRALGDDGGGGIGGLEGERGEGGDE